MNLSFLKKFTIGRLLVALYLLVCVVVGYNIYPIVKLTNQSIEGYHEIFDKSTRKLELMNELRKNFNTIQSAQFRHVLAYSEIMMNKEEETLLKALSENNIIFSEYQQLIDSKEEQAYLDTVLFFRKLNAATRAELIKLSASNERQIAFDYYISTQEKSRLNYSNAVEELTENIVLQTQDKIKTTENYIRNKRIAINIVLGVSVFLMVITGIVVLVSNRKLNQQYIDEKLRESNYFLNTVLENIPNMIFVKDAGDLKFVRINLVGEKLLGYKREDLIGKSDYDFFPKEQADYFVNKDKEVLKEGELIEIKEELITTAKGERWLHTKKIPINDKDGNPAYLLGISDDITDRKKTEEALAQLKKELEQKTEEKLKATTTQLEKVLNIFDNSFWGADIINDRMLYVSPGNEKVFGYPEKDFMENGSLWFELVVEEDKNKFASAWEQLRQGKSTFTEFRINHPHKGIRWVESKMAPTLDENGKLMRIDGIAIDINERKKIENEMRENNMELRKINSELDSFVYSTSHDLRAPLLSLEGLLNLSEEHIDSREELHQYLSIMRKITMEMDDTIKSILEYSRNARKEIVAEQMDIRLMVQNALTRTSHMMGKESIKFTLFINDTVPFFSDKMRLNTIISNLISNAYKFSRDDEQNPFVRFSFISDAQEGVITVEDNGEGIPPEYLDKIFEMFMRASEKSEGSGLGLYICKEIADRLQGSITVDSEIHRGSRFVVRIPNFKIKHNQL